MMSRHYVMALICFSAAFAQIDRATLSGTVTDGSSSAVPSARISVVSSATGQTREALSDGQGLYRVTNLLPGAYTVNIAKDGFSTAKIENVVLGVGTSRTVNVQLQLSQVATQINVEAAAALIEQTTAEIGSVVESKQIGNIPINGRNWSFLMTLAPGAVNTGEGTQNSVRFFGRGRDDNNWTYDGVDATGVKDPRQEGGLRLVMSLDAISEFKVNSGVYNAEGGTGAGAQVNLVSKTGTNQFRGSAFHFLRNDALDARRFIDGPALPDFRLNQFGANLGGPIVKNRTFFFANYEALRQRQGQTAVSALVPSSAFRARVVAQSPDLRFFTDNWLRGQTPVDADTDRFTGVFRSRWNENAGMARVDHQINNKLSTFFRISITDGSFNDRRSGLLEFRESFVRPSNATWQLQQVYSPTLINETKIGVNRSALARPQTGIFPVGLEVPGFTTTLTSTAIREVPSSYSLVDNLSLVRGRHTFKFGGEVRRIHLNSATNPEITVRYASRDAFIRNAMDRLRIDATLPMFGGRRTYWIGFAQDEWRVSKNLTLNYGVRYEYYSVMSEVNGRGRVLDFTRCGGFCPAGTPWYFPDRNNFAPRLGLAWSIAPRTVIRTGFGMFYGPGQNDDVSAAIDSEPERLQLTAAENSSLRWPIEPFFAQARGQGASPRNLQRDRQDNTTPQWSFMVQQGLPGNFVGQIGYIGSRGYNLFGRSRINVLNPVTRTRPYPAFGEVDSKDNWAQSTFHGLQASLQRTFTRGWLFQSQYMWSKSIDNNAGSGEGSEPMNNACFACERGPSDFDIRHTFTANSVYELPFGKGRRWGPQSGLAGIALGGWDLSGIFTARTGRPVNVLVDRATGAVPDGNTRQQRPDLVLGVPLYLDFAGTGRFLNSAAFRAPAAGTFGNLGRNFLRAPGLWQTDLALTKRTRLTERVNLEFRAEAFNIFNRAQLGSPVNNISRADFGQITGTVNDGPSGFGTPRNLQFMLRLNF